MDITEALRNEDLSKTDFFDFVSCPEMTDATRLTRSPSSGGSGFMEGLQDLKETNNNHLPSADGLEHLLWNGNGGGGSEDMKDTVKLETAIFEDWNKLWGHAVVTTAPDPDPAPCRTNTDGAIYTLTVLNGDHPASWFAKPEDVTGQCVTGGASQVDIDSLLSIVAPLPAPADFRTDVTALPSASTTFTFVEDTPTSGDPLLNEASGDCFHSSLLRSALQGKASFVSRYNIKVEQDLVGGAGEEGSGTHSELTAVPSPVVQDENLSQDSSPSVSSQTLFAQTGVLPSMFDNPTMDSEPSAHSMDELLLSQLDVTYDYEKLRCIENEVAESVQRYCNSSSTGSINGTLEVPTTTTTSASSTTNPPIYKIPAVSTAASSTTQSSTTSSSTAATPTVTSNKSKKYSKRTKNPTEKSTAGATTNGVRKERSLHYCNICSKGFKDKYSVNVHIRTHTGEKPFACTLCGKSFRQKAHLAKHYQTHAQKTTSTTLSSSPCHKTTKR